MKKVITSILSITLLLSAFALNSWATESKLTSADVKANLDAVAQQTSTAVLKSGNAGFFVTWGNDTAITSILKAGVPCKELQDGYLTALKAALKTNNGKLLYSGAENASAYTNTLVNLELMGLDGTNFDGYNLLNQMLAMPRDKVTGATVNLYQRAAILRAVEKYDASITDKTLKADLITSLTNDFKDNVEAKDYTGASLGFFVTGYENYGVSVDNNGHVIGALAPYYATNDIVKSQIDKTMVWNETMKKPTGYGGEPQYTPNANPSSTAMALFASSSIKDNDKAGVTYGLLMGLKEANADTFGSAFYDQDALRGLVAYYELLLSNEKEEPTTQETIPATTLPPAATTVVPTTTTTPSTTKPNKENGSSIPKAGQASIATFVLLSAAAASALTIMQCRKKKEA